MDKLGEHMLPGAGQVRRDPVRTADGLMSDRFGRAGSWLGERLVEPVAIEGGVDAADHGDAESAAEEPGGVVDRRTNSSLGRGNGAHDGLGGGGGGQAHAKAVEDHLHGDDVVASGCGNDARDPQVEDACGEEADGDDGLGPETDSKASAQRRSPRRQKQRRGEGARLPKGRCNCG